MRETSINLIAELTNSMREYTHYTDIPHVANITIVTRHIREVQSST